MGRRLAAVVLLALACAGAALAGGHDPQQRHTPADLKLARSVVLRRADLSTWKATPSDNTSADNLSCKGFDPDESKFVETGSADSPDFERGLEYIGSSVSVFETAAQAQADWGLVVRPGLLTCLEALLEQQGGGPKLTVLHKGTLSFPKLAPRTAAFRVAFSAVSEGVTLKGAVDFVLLGRNRIDAVLYYVSFGAGPSQALERRLAGLMAARMR